MIELERVRLAARLLTSEGEHPSIKRKVVIEHNGAAAVARETRRSYCGNAHQLCRSGLTCIVKGCFLYMFGHELSGVSMLMF